MRDVAEPTRRRSESRTKLTVYAFGAVYLSLAYATHRGVTPVALLVALNWIGGVAIVVAVRRVEARSHPGQRGWWTWWVLLLGMVGVLSWLRHLDREH